MLQLLASLRNWWLHRVGRRGSSLLFFGFLDCVIGWSIFTLPEPAKALTPYRFIASLAPLEVWAGLWCLVGLLCLVFAFRWWDGIAFTAAIALFSLWGIIYAAGEVVGEIYRGYVAASVWFGFAALVGVISGWPETQGGDKWTQESSSEQSP